MFLVDNLRGVSLTHQTMNETKIQEMFEKEDAYWWFAARRDMVLTLLRKYVKRGTKLLDAGCGAGLLTKTVDHLYDVTATDISPLSLVLTKRRKPKAKLLIANLEKKLPIPADQFDGAVLLDVLEHIDDTKALPNLHRVLKQHGVLIITVPAYPWLFSYWDILHQHKRRYTRGRLTTLLEHYGFAVVHTSYFNTLLFPLILLIRLVKSSFGMLETQHTDCYELPKTANSLLLSVFRKETQLATRIQIPFGLSLLVVCEKITDGKKR